MRQRIRTLIEEILEAELDAVLHRQRYERAGPAQGHRHGHRDRQIVGTFGPITVSTPRAPLHAETAKDVKAMRKASVRTWWLKCLAVADSLEEAGPRLFRFLRYPPEQWKSIRTTTLA
jgi:transposase-like protein